MEHVVSNLYPCAHCGGTGTCSSGEGGASCAACVKAHELKAKGLVGVACGTCGGIGLAEPRTERINKRIKPVIAMFIVFVMLFMVGALAFTNNPHFTEILAFASTLIGAIVAYYFAGSKSCNT